MRENARGANVTMTGDNAAFEQALTAAHFLAASGRKPVLVGGADEMHPIFSPLFDHSVTLDDTPSDGGGMLLLDTAEEGAGVALRPGLLAPVRDIEDSLAAAAAFHGGPDGINQHIGAIMLGIPAAWREKTKPHLDAFLGRLGFNGPVIDYRRYVGEFATASAVAAVVALALVERGTIPGPLTGGSERPLDGRAILLVAVGSTLSTMLAESS
jgi:3-oxoacyl-[acyl-carrier-protein] synthase-1/3-oxoacyl-[acyl-carrier-protein] synthase II